MPFFFKGKQKSFLEGEPYYALYRSGFAKEHGSKAACLATLDNVKLPIGTEIEIEKIYRMKRGYEPDAPFRSGDTAEYWTFSLKSAATWYDPKTGGAVPNKWAATGHGIRKRSGEPFEERDEQAARRRRGIMTEQRSDPRDAHNEDMRVALGTVGHNRQFSVRDLTEYLHGRIDSNSVKYQLQKLVRSGYVARSEEGYYVTTLGWNWIEGVDRSPHVSEASHGPPSYARPAPPAPISAEDAMVEAVTWLHFGRTPENALPWLTYASQHAVDQQDFDEIAKYDAQVQRIVPEKWRAYHQRRLVIPMRYHPRSIGQTKPVRRH